MADDGTLARVPGRQRDVIISMIRFLALRVWIAEAEPGPARTMADFLGWFRQYSREVLLPQVTEQDVVDVAELLGEASRDRSAPAADGMTMAEFAAWFGCDHRTIGKSVVVVPPGPPPRLAPGKVPARQVGNVKRIFKTDVLGHYERRGGDDGGPAEASSSSDGGSRWHRQMDRLRGRAD